MIGLILESSLLLLYFDVILSVRGLHRVHDIIRGRRVSSLRAVPPSVTELCQAVDFGCVFYFKRVLCLQRSAATTVLLRRYGWNSELVIGAQVRPFKSHAWVEVEGLVVNDKPYMLDIYQELERC